MGEKAKGALKLQFDKRLRLEFHGTIITSDGGLLACRYSKAQRGASLSENKQ